MAEVQVHIGDSDHLLACDDGQEERLKHLSREFDALVSAAKAKHDGLNDRQAVLIAALALLDEYDEAKTRWAAATPEGKAAEWAAAQLDLASERLEKALDP